MAKRPTKREKVSVRSVMALVDHYAVGLSEAEAGGEGWDHRAARNRVAREIRRLARKGARR